MPRPKKSPHELNDSHNVSVEKKLERREFDSDPQETKKIARYFSKYIQEMEAKFDPKPELHPFMYRIPPRQ